MKVGDLVKIKWTTFAAMRRSRQFGRPSDELGLVVEVSSGKLACKVIFPSVSGRWREQTFLMDNLEAVNE